MGIVPSVKDPKTTTPGAKRRSTQLDFSGLSPLKNTGTVGFSAFRDRDAEANQRRKSRKSVSGTMDDSDDDDDDSKNPLLKMDDTDDKDVKTHLAPEDAELQAELKAGIDRIRVSIGSSICILALSDLLY